jgi:hypothetical protein
MWKVSSARSYQLAALLVLASAGFGAGWTLSTPGGEPTRGCSETCGGLPVTGALATAAQGPEMTPHDPIGWGRSRDTC